MTRASLRRALPVVVAGMLAAAVARAQQLDQVLDPGIRGVANEAGVTVTSRERPDYDFRGVRVGSGLLRPLLTASPGYTSNATGTTRARGSSLLQTRLDVQAASDLSRYGWAGRLLLDDVRYFDQPRQSTTTWAAIAGGFYDFGRDTASLGYTHQNLNQTPRDLNTLLLDAPIEYRVDTVRLNYRAVFNRLSLRPELAVARYDFDDGTVAGVQLPQRFRNRIVVTPGVVASYELAPRRTLVAVARNSTARYTDTPSGSPRRDYNDASLLFGIDLDSGALLRTRLLVGYEIRTFSDRSFKTIQAPVVEGTVIYTPTGLTTVTGTAARRILDSASESTSGFTETAVQLRVDHEYLRNVLLRAQAGVTFAEFGQSGGQQTLYGAGAGATWLLNRNMRLGASYDFATRRSSEGRAVSANPTPTLGATTILGGNYTESRYLLQLSLGL